MEDTFDFDVSSSPGRDGAARGRLHLRLEFAFNNLVETAKLAANDDFSTTPYYWMAEGIMSAAAAVLSSEEYREFCRKHEAAIISLSTGKLLECTRGEMI